MGGSQKSHQFQFFPYRGRAVATAGDAAHRLACCREGLADTAAEARDLVVAFVTVAARREARMVEEDVEREREGKGKEKKKSKWKKKRAALGAGFVRRRRLYLLSPSTSTSTAFPLSLSLHF